MFLLNFTNVDYVAMTFIFATLAGISYYFRRRNPDSKSFLSASSYKIGTKTFSIMLSNIGLLEFVIFSAFGALYGVSAGLLLLVVYFFINCLPINALPKFRLSMNDLFLQNKTFTENKVFYVAYGVFILLVAALAILSGVGILKNWLGWEFGNSALSLFFVLAVCLLIGGFAAVIYSQAIFTIASIVVLSVAVIFSLKSLGLDGVIHNLQSVALDNKEVVNTYITLPKFCLTQYILMFLVVIVIFLSRPLNIFIKSRSCNSKFRASVIINTVLIALGIASGVLALATPKYNNLPANSKVITQPTKLDDGSMGITVKLVSTDTPTMQKGILPQNIDFNGSFADRMTSLTDDAISYNYLEAGFSLIKHNILYASIALLLLVIMFYKTMTDSISFVTMLTINGFYAPYHNKTGEEYENLWASRVFMFMFLVLTIMLGLLFYKFFDFSYLSGLVILCAMPITTYIIGFRLNIVVYVIDVLLIITSLLLLNIQGVISLVPIFSFSNWWQFIVIGSSCLVLVNIVSHFLLGNKN